MDGMKSAARRDAVQPRDVCCITHASTGGKCCQLRGRSVGLLSALQAFIHVDAGFVCKMEASVVLLGRWLRDCWWHLQWDIGITNSTDELCAVIYPPLHIGPASNPVAVSRVLQTARILDLVWCFCARCVQSEHSHWSPLSSDWLSALLRCMDLSYRGQLFARIFKKQDKERTFQHCISSIYIVIASSDFAAVASGTARAFLGENQYSFLMLYAVDLWRFI